MLSSSKHSWKSSSFDGNDVYRLESFSPPFLVEWPNNWTYFNNFVIFTRFEICTVTIGFKVSTIFGDLNNYAFYEIMKHRVRSKWKQLVLCTVMIFLQKKKKKTTYFCKFSTTLCTRVFPAVVLSQLLWIANHLCFWLLLINDIPLWHREMSMCYSVTISE